MKFVNVIGVAYAVITPRATVKHALSAGKEGCNCSVPTGQTYDDVLTYSRCLYSQYISGQCRTADGIKDVADRAKDTQTDPDGVSGTDYCIKSSIIAFRFDNIEHMYVNEIQVATTGNCSAGLELYSRTGSPIDCDDVSKSFVGHLDKKTPIGNSWYAYTSKISDLFDVSNADQLVVVSNDENCTVGLYDKAVGPTKVITRFAIKSPGQSPNSVGRRQIMNLVIVNLLLGAGCLIVF